MAREKFTKKDRLPEILPCPFCGSPGRLGDEFDAVIEVVCASEGGKCTVWGPSVEVSAFTCAAAEAIKLWNSAPRNATPAIPPADADQESK